jgi:hypothetical protein
MFIESPAILFVFPDKPVDTLMAYHCQAVPPGAADDLLRRPLLFCRFFNDFLKDTVRKSAFESVTLLAFIGIYLDQTGGIAPLMAVTLKFSADNQFVFSNRFGDLFLFFSCPE